MRARQAGPWPTTVRPPNLRVIRVLAQRQGKTLMTFFKVFVTVILLLGMIIYVGYWPFYLDIPLFIRTSFIAMLWAFSGSSFNHLWTKSDSLRGARANSFRYTTLRGLQRGGYFSIIINACIEIAEFQVLMDDPLQWLHPPLDKIALSCIYGIVISELVARPLIYETRYSPDSIDDQSRERI